jgi:hypothetical protein
MTNGPSIQVLSEQKNPDIGSAAVGYISSGNIFIFFNSEDSRPSNFFIPNSKRLRGYTQ